MKVAITGHTRGIGKAIADLLASQGHTIVGISRSTGHDLTIESQYNAALELITNCDIFVNNALPMDTEPHRHQAFIPFELLYKIHRRWKGNGNKLIIVIGSGASDSPLGDDRPYQVGKIALDAACHQLRKYPRIVLVKPGCTDTDSVKSFNEVKMDPIEVANTINFCIQSMNDVYISEITVLPGKKYYDKPATTSS